MGHSTNILTLRGGITFKWNVFFSATHYVNYYSEYNYFFNLLRNYVYFLLKYRYRRLFYFFGIHFGFLRVKATKMNRINLRIYLHDHFFLESFKMLSKKFWYRKLSFFTGDKKKKKKKAVFRFKFRNRFKFKINRFTKKFENQIQNINYYASSDFRFKLFNNKYKFNFFNNKISILKDSFVFFLRNGFFYERFDFFRKKRIIKRLFFFQFFLKSFVIEKFDNEYKSRIRDLSINKQNLLNVKRFDNSLLLSEFKVYKKEVRRKNRYYRRAKGIRKFFKLLFILNYSNFFFRKFVKYSLKRKKFTIHGKYLFIIMYLIYQTRFRKIRQIKRNKKKYKYLGVRNIYFLRVLPYMMSTFIEYSNSPYGKKYKAFRKILKYFYILLKRWLWLLVFNKVIKRFYIYIYGFFKHTLYHKLFRFFASKSLIDSNISPKNNRNIISLNDINVYPLSARTLSLALVLKYINWKLKRRFTLNQTVWPFLKDLKKKSRFVRGFYFKGCGRFTKKQRADIKKYKYGKVAFSTYYTRLNYAFLAITTRYGMCGLKLWVNISWRHTNHLYRKIYKIALY